MQYGQGRQVALALRKAWEVPEACPPRIGSMAAAKEGTRPDLPEKDGRYWIRTSDPFRVKEVRYRCANRPWRPNLWWEPPK
jgi:hypothetical protein